MSRNASARALRVAVALSMAVVLLGVPTGRVLAAQKAPVPNGPVVMAASGCTITPLVIMYPVGRVVTGRVKWGPHCPTNIQNTESIWEQTSPGNWMMIWQEMMPDVETTGSGYFWMDHGYYCGGIGLWRARAYVGGQYVWSSPAYCP